MRTLGMRTLVVTLCVFAAAWGGRVQAIRDPLHMLAWAGAWFAVSWMVHSPKRAKHVVVVVPE